MLSLNRKTVTLALSLALVLSAVGITVYRGNVGADSLNTEVANIAEVSYKDSRGAVKAVSNSVGVTIETLTTPTPQSSEFVFSDAGGKRLTAQRMQFNITYKRGNEVNPKAKIYFVYDYFDPSQPLPLSEAKPKLTRSIDLGRKSSPVGYYANDLSGNANRHVVGYFEARVGGTVATRSEYYYIDAKTGSLLTLLP